MKIVNCEQGTPAWLHARLGIPTASNFDSIITDKKLEPSKSQGPYRARLIAEWYLGQVIEDAGSGFMARGTGMEEEAANWYAFQHDADVSKVGFCLRDDGIAGCSPDRFVGDDGLLEIKCLAAHTHMGYVLGGGDAYGLQVQGQLWVTGRAWCDRLFYHPSIPSVCVRVLPDPAVFKAFDEHIPAFARSLAEARNRLSDAKAEYEAKLVAASDHAF